MYQSTKTFGHDLGLSAAFRQWRANSHCNQIHGYALSFRFTFASEVLDERNWVIDFGSLKPLKASLEEIFDHKLLVAHDDPELGAFMELQERGLASVHVVKAVGCEAFAQMAFALAEEWLYTNGHAPRVWLDSVEVREHGANSAIYYGEDVE